MSCILVLMLVMVGSACSQKPSPQDKKKANAFINLGLTYLGQGNPTAALGEFLKAEKLMPNDPILHYDLGVAYMEKDRLDLAIVHLQKAIQLSPEYVVAKNDLGNVYIAQKNWDAAIAVLQDAADNILYATPYYPLTNLGIAYYEKKDYTKAETYFQKALSSNPKFVVAKYHLGRTYFAAGKLKEARDILEEATETESKNPFLLLEIGRVYRKLGDRHHAELALKAAMDLSPDSDSVIKNEIAAELRRLSP